VTIEEEIQKVFGGKLRLRVCGLLIEDEKILVIKHLGVGPNGFLWGVPGGGLEFGESVDNCLKREFLEETGLEVEVLEFYSFNEYIKLPLHSVELFFKVKRKSGVLKEGFDPELSINKGITQHSFLSFKEFMASELENYHSIFKNFRISGAFC